MRILICPDSFKGSMSSVEFCEKTEKFIIEHHPDWEVMSIPMADGGEGSLDALRPHLPNATMVTCEASDALLRPVKASYLTDHDTAYIEMALTSGLPLIPPEMRNLMKSNTYGTGQVVVHALRSGFRKIVLFGGGSATLDGGTGLLQALGFHLYDKNRQLLDVWENALIQVKSIEYPADALSDISFTLVHDVNNPLCGPNGAARVFGPQKGGNTDEIEVLDTALQGFRTIVQEFCTSSNFDEAGMGAAGGLGLAFKLLNGAMVNGAYYFIEKSKLNSYIAASDLVITGEGRFDNQSFMGKITGKVIDLCNSAGKKCVVICGTRAKDVSTLSARIISFTEQYSESFSMLHPNQCLEASIPKALK